MDAPALTRVLCRADLKRGQLTLLKVLYERDDEVAREELAKKLRGEIHEEYVHSFNSVLGAFGRRINETDTVPETPGIDAFLQKKEPDKTYYELREEGRTAIEEIPALLETFEAPLEDLLESGTKIPAENLVPRSD